VDFRIRKDNIGFIQNTGWPCSSGVDTVEDMVVRAEKLRLALIEGSNGHSTIDWFNNYVRP